MASDPVDGANDMGVEDSRLDFYNTLGVASDAGEEANGMDMEDSRMDFSYPFGVTSKAITTKLIDEMQASSEESDQKI